MYRVNSCCCCINLETGGQIWGWLGIIGGVMAVLQEVFSLNAGFKISTILSIMLLSLVVFMNWLLIKGIKEKSFEKIKYCRNFALAGYIFVVVVILVILFTDIENTLMLLEYNKQEFTELGETFQEAVIVGLVIFLLFDFGFRFLVINSLYYKYKQQAQQI